MNVRAGFGRVLVFLGLISLFAAGHARVAAAGPVAELAEALPAFEKAGKRLAVPEKVVVRDPSGGPVSLSGFEGQVVVVNFWATWCGPCIEELPALDRLHKKMRGKPVRVVAVNEDRDGDVAAPFLERQGLKALKAYTDPENKARRAFNVTGLPTTWILDSEGRAVGRVMGIAEWGAPRVRRALLALAEADE